MSHTLLPSRRLSWPDATSRPPGQLEWLVANGLGGYACGTVAGGLTRRYHGLLIAALPAPLGRTLYVSQLRSTVTVGDETVVIDHEDFSRLSQPDVAALVEFRLDGGLPVWRYRVPGGILEKRVVMLHGANTTIVRYRLEAPNGSATLRLTPLIQVRSHDSQSPVVRPDTMRIAHVDRTWHLEVEHGLPALRWAVHGGVRHADFSTPLATSLEYAVERERGYAHAGLLWYPGTVELDATDNAFVDIVISTEPAASLGMLDPQAACDGEAARREALVARVPVATRDRLTAELVIAADAFLILPATRRQEVTHDAAHGQRPCTIIAGYHWFTDWGRDTMISLEGLVLRTGRTDDAAAILRTFAKYVRDGLIPNMFPEGEQQGLYHTADATLWFLHALDRYTTLTGDRQLVADLLPVVSDILTHHLEGTRFGIGVDETDGLIRQGAPHYQLTWMDAKVGDWVVTPRRGKAVEINALWYNALRLAEKWLFESGNRTEAARFGHEATRVATSFNARFWNDDTGYLFDVIDGEHGNDPACRPNQLFAISLPNPVLSRDRWNAVVEVVERELLTPVGLRSLAPGHHDYQKRYFGDLHSRDAAYHQGTVWAWLIGPFIDARLKVSGDLPGDLRTTLAAFDAHMSQACVGTIAEIFDAEAPYTPRGCVAQAWSVAEVLRCLVRPDDTPPMPDESSDARSAVRS